MSYAISDTTISLTRGDTCKIQVEILDYEGNPFKLDEGDEVRFAMKRNYTDEEPLLVIDIPITSLILSIKPEDTKELAFGSYVYDIQLTTAAGEVDTFITKAAFKITEEVY